MDEWNDTWYDKPRVIGTRSGTERVGALWGARCECRWRHLWWGGCVVAWLRGCMRACVRAYRGCSFPSREVPNR